MDQFFRVNFFSSELTLDKFLNICSGCKIIPFRISEILTENNHQYYIVIFKLNMSIKDKRVKFLIKNALNRLFIKDRPQKKLSHHKKHKTVIASNLQNTINILNTIMALYLKYALEDIHGHIARKVRQFCRECYINSVNDVPDLRFDDSSKSSFFSELYYRDCYKNATYAINFCIPEEQFSPIKKTTRGGYKFNPASNITNYSFKRILKRNYNFDEMVNRCALACQFESGIMEITANEFNHLLVRYIQIQGGEERFFRCIEAQEKYILDDTIKKTRYLIKWYKANNYQPFGCTAENCFFYASCKHSKLLFEDFFTIKKGQIKQVEKLNFKAPEIIFDELKKTFDQILNENEPKIYGIKAPTGIGKTKCYLSKKEILVAVPTHKLAKEIVERMRAEGNEVITVGKLPSITEEIDRNIASWYKIGGAGHVSRYITNLISKIDKNLITVNFDVTPLKEYYSNLISYKKRKITAVITHERLFNNFKIGQKCIIIDEDPLKSLLKINSLSLEDLYYLNTVLGNDRYSDTGVIIRMIISQIEKAQVGTIYRTARLIYEDQKKLESIVIEHARNLKSNLLGFVESDYFVKEAFDDKFTINYLRRRDLPKDKKVIILSATLNEKLYKALYPNQFEFIDFGSAETKGQIIQNHHYSFSRWSINKHNIVPIIQKKFGEQSIITFKKFKNVDGFKIEHTFGATEGLNSLQGQNIVVLGTPHYNNIVYYLFAKGLHVNFTNEDKEFNYIKITRNGYEFWFNTFVNNLWLREIQLHLIESELQQAIGRARIIDNSNTVYLFSNYPIPGAKLENDKI